MIKSDRLGFAGLALGLALTLGALAVVGAFPAPIPGLPNPGTWVPWALAGFTFLARTSLVVVVGFLVLATILVPSGPELEGLAVRAVRIAASAAYVWALASGATFVLSLSEQMSRPMSSFTLELVWAYANWTLGRALLIHLLFALVVAVALRWTLKVTSLVVCLALAMGSLVPLGLTGHAATSGSHALASTSLVLHMTAATLWVGGLVALAWFAARGSRRLRASVERFSPIALWASLTVIGTGIISGITNLGSLSEVATGYGALLGFKAMFGVILIAFGYLQRRRYLAGHGGFLHLAIVEGFVMVSAFAIGVALSFSPRPVGEAVIVTPAELLLGGPLPPEPTLARLLWGFTANGTGLAIVIFGVALYGWGVRVLRGRGDAWPIGRTISWCTGLAVVGWATCGGLGVYSPVMFSLHMVSHMMLSMVATIFLVLGAPMTLALRALPGPREPGEHSPRSLLNSFLHSGFSRFVTHPIAAATIFMGSLYAIYFTGAFEYLMRSHTGHAFMEIHFLLSGFLFYYVIVGVDPSPRRIPPLARFGVLMVSLPFHAFFSVTLMGYSTVIAKSFYTTLDRPYATDLLADQRLGGGITWGMGELPLLIVMAALFVQWIRTDLKDSTRLDRAAARDGDAELEAYNAMLARMSSASHNDDAPHS
jgi:cytochrome c oxidase assembly factor CtaG/putative copper export protein